MPGAFKLDPFQPIEPILLEKIFNFFIFILGGQFLLPQRANNGKGNGQLLRTTVLIGCVKRVQGGGRGPIILKILRTYLMEAPLPPRTNNEKRAIAQLLKWIG